MSGGAPTRAGFFEPERVARFDPRAVATGCVESGSGRLLLDADALSAEFFDLSSGVAGELLHRLGLYGIRLAAVVPDPTTHSQAFQDFVRESNRGTQYRFFATRDTATAWLIG